ncbi:hypothetical protein G3O06_20535 [Burkholderia sp. Ac-20345]|uniref:hypothetical protein n=1 Tax=Burkholderia sp. Ac-20345 TaxID=2703891 RepID=UPI00197BCF80|nr:hypothetical protein [Burkholderia sp. Ac-20345]MBN3779927.1 hypothetical protein [Burkholderia sp. Ac-20345]
MTAAIKDRDTPLREAVQFAYSAKGGKVSFVGAMIAIDSGTGFAAPCTGAATETVVGVNRYRTDTTGMADGAIGIEVRRGCYRFTNDTAAPYSSKDIGTAAHALDDSTVSKSGQSPAGIVRDIDANGDVWIEL